MLLALPALAQDRRIAVFTTAPYGGGSTWLPHL